MADVHSNLPALESVLAEVDSSDDIPIVCLGDVVGYGADPNDCLDVLRDLNATIVAGNHDAAACGQMDTTYFNRFARRAAEWTEEKLTEDNRQFLRDLPDTTKDKYFQYFHGSPDSPLTEYITSPRQARHAIDTIEGQKLAVGHTHQPAVYRSDGLEFSGKRIRGTSFINGITSSEKLVINPGSVGQPRDGDPRAAYVELKTHGNGKIDLTWNRVEYDVNEAQRRIRNADLPHALADRLSRGQ
jgi:diadenosine tetraphosphatase ApaH/serine/threonine PP2A family protein phosphatase